ncbi:copper resistance protein CopC [Nesterenkonia sp. E16_7]|uniref:copper resistance CopC family protein n=1 Tax=unclassified Nesterenkonia TaxID=2629769 RepID=UPI001A914596|nr:MULTISPECIES: copper resistance CopC family protein [unclassified Nesterenkonia]MBO0596714.1 copper resistance protein CopC [Nesterenkonia sp. E16_10]MBO0597892.1 copper resistance protein CopC [Nesterenkonia sp. E16_7]
MSSCVPTARNATTGRQRAGRITALSATAALGLAVTTMAAPAWAHDSLIASSPEADAVLQESPEEITLEFSGGGLTTGDSITNVIVVTDEGGENWEGETEVEGATLSTELAEELPGGDYTVAYRVVYSDGHAEEQSFGFEVAESEAEPTPGASPESTAEAPDPEETEAEAETETESAAPAEDEDADSTPDSSAADTDEAEEPVAGDTAADTQQDSGLPVWAVVVGGIVVVGLLAAIATAVLRGRKNPRA